MEHQVSRQAILSTLFQSPHGTLEAYRLPTQTAVLGDATFLAHALAWNQRHGSMRDSRVGIPVCTLNAPTYPYREHSLALLACLDPRDLQRAWQFGATLPLGNQARKRLKWVTHAYLRAREASPPWWERTELSFRRALASLYRVSQTKPVPYAQATVFDRQPPPASLRGRLQACATWDAETVAGFLRAEHIPSLIAEGYLGPRCQEPPILAALVEGYTAAQMLKRRKTLRRWGISDIAATRGALHQATLRAMQTARADTLLVAHQAAIGLEADPALAAEVEAVQEAQLDAQQGIEGDGVFLADKSGSMQHSIRIAQLLAGFVARQGRGRVWLTFFDTEPYTLDVSGKTYADIQRLTAGVTAGGGTSIGCGLAAHLDQQHRVDWIGIVSDGGENVRPTFVEVYHRYTQWVGTQVPVSLYHVPGERDVLTPSCQAAGLPYQVFPLAATVDQYSLQTIAQTMRTGRYELVQQILDTPLITVEQALRVPKRWRDYVHAV